MGGREFGPAAGHVASSGDPGIAGTPSDQLRFPAVMDMVFHLVHIL
jgi:hypothetical protein